MVSLVDISFRLKQFAGILKGVVKEVGELRREIGVNEMWDNADMIRNWKVSSRTLATWRAEGLIGYVQVGGKIWYPREVRELFLSRNLIKEGKKNDGEEV
jgi:hypothetical protein